MMCRVKQEILDDAQFKRKNIEDLLLEVLVDIRDRVETLCAVERKRLTVEEKTLKESQRRNQDIRELTRAIDGLPQPDVEVEVEATP